MIGCDLRRTGTKGTKGLNPNNRARGAGGLCMDIRGQVKSTPLTPLSPPMT